MRAVKRDVQGRVVDQGSGEDSDGDDEDDGDERGQTRDTSCHDERQCREDGIPRHEDDGDEETKQEERVACGRRGSFPDEGRMLCNPIGLHGWCRSCRRSRRGRM